jgi:hypothetical protein
MRKQKALTGKKPKSILSFQLCFISFRRKTGKAQWFLVPELVKTGYEKRKFLKNGNSTEQAYPVAAMPVPSRNVSPAQFCTEGICASTLFLIYA